MTMKLKYLGWVALSGLFAVSLAGCAAQSGQTAPAGSEQAVVQTEETQGPAAGQAAVDEQADAEADAATAEQEAAKRKAEEESAAEPQQSQNVQRQTAGTGQGRAQRQESVQTPSTTQRQQQSSTPSAPSWSVPSENDDGGMPDTDPGL